MSASLGLPQTVWFEALHHAVTVAVYIALTWLAIRAVSGVERAINMENVHLTEPAVVGDEVRLQVDVLATTFRRPGEGDVPAEGAEGAAPGGGS